MKNILIIGGTRGIGKAIVNEVITRNKVICLSRNNTDYDHDNYGFKSFLLFNYGFTGFNC